MMIAIVRKADGKSLRRHLLVIRQLQLPNYTVEGARLLLRQNRSQLSAKSIAKIEQHIQAMSAGTRKRPQPCLAIEAREADAPSAVNGYRRLDFDRVAALVHELASNCRDLYWTKLQKAVFFTDMACFEQTSRSLTGLTYAHATHGPVIDRKDEVRYLLVEYEVIDFREHGWGEVLVPERINVQPFNSAELALIDQIAAFINTFSSSAELSSFSHKLSCWNRSTDGEIIEYISVDGEVSRAIRERMEAPGAI